MDHRLEATNGDRQGVQSLPIAPSSIHSQSTPECPARPWDSVIPLGVGSTGPGTFPPNNQGFLPTRQGPATKERRQLEGLSHTSSPSTSEDPSAFLSWSLR